MSDFACDRCGAALLARESVRYKLEMKITSAYDTLELSPDELERRDGDAELNRLVVAALRRTAEENEAEVHKEFAFDLCHRCQRELVADPLPKRQRDETPPR